MGTARITHSHPSAVNGALLQAMAVKMALFSKAPLNPVEFLDALIPCLQMLWSWLSCHYEEQQVNDGLPTYQSQLLQIRSFLCADERPSADVVQHTLGHGIKAGKLQWCVCVRACVRVCVCFVKEWAECQNVYISLTSVCPMFGVCKTLELH